MYAYVKTHIGMVILCVLMCKEVFVHAHTHARTHTHTQAHAHKHMQTSHNNPYRYSRLSVHHSLRITVKARPTTPSGIVEAKVTQRLILECRANENGGGTHIDFQWSTATAPNLAMFSVLAPTNEAISEYNVGNDLNVNDSGAYVCTPTNVIGSKGSVTYTVTVSKFDPPDNLTVSCVDEDSLEVMVTWNPIVVDQGMYPGANIGEYVIELHVNTVNGFVKVDEVAVPGNTTSAKFNVNSVQNYWAQIKARTGNRDVSDFSPYSGSCASTVPVNTGGGKCSFHSAQRISLYSCME